MIGTRSGLSRGQGRVAALAIAALSIACIGIAAAPRQADPAAKPALPPVAAAAPPALRVPVASLAFLAGDWRGPMGEDFAEEIWSPPRGSSIMGCFRWVTASGTPTMFEILTITEEADATRLRIRHFSPVLAALEEAAKPMSFVLTEHGPERAVFEAERDSKGVSRIVYAAQDARLAIDVEFAPVFKEESKSTQQREPLRFRLTR